MTDRFAAEKRSQIMAKIKGRNTSPERLVQRCLRSLKCRYRSNVKQLPGKPDILLIGHRKLIFVHGCFWHGHNHCPRSKRPTTNILFWNRKIDSNIKRDKRLRCSLHRLGWKVLVVWECKTRKPEALRRAIERFVNES